ncbi:phage tail tape measure protein, lambda family [Rhodovulum sp. ES.010]|uniref:phage tail tape measure protein n=1 Tax=Rhodovulum sp. ES.010 TaxID=1882821 RepID=UPI0009273A05|nr:phage tail tape measure protein [Rhodovulum sp. ES.010]SIO11010.1 phage tail tape measure protein, lambda family [Rhodovulum sp. ES.010]
MAKSEDYEAFEDQIEALETTLGGARGTAAAFELELVRMRESLTLTNREVGALSRSIGRGLRSAFDGLVFDGMKLSDALKTVANSIVNATYSAAIKPVQNQLGGLIAGGIEGLVNAALPFGKGGAFTQGQVIPFATGGVVDQATYFPMRGATGLMGEAGPEAILPLSRGADGRLGVRSEGGGRPVQVVMNITTPDLQGFARSQSQVASEMSRLIARGQRNR